jgi:hypothetical protein
LHHFVFQVFGEWVVSSESVSQCIDMQLCCYSYSYSYSYSGRPITVTVTVVVLLQLQLQ